LVLWTRGTAQQFISGLSSGQGQASRDLEFYLAGDVVIRERDDRGSKTLHADEVYYDVNRNVAVAIRANLEVTQRGIPEPLHLTAQELDKESLDHYHGYQAE